MAAGLDRMVMLLAREHNLREVAVFPMTQRAEDLLMGAPSEVSPKQLKELHIRLDLPYKVTPIRTTSMPGAKAPKVFISYSWSSTQHQQWVLDLATQLRENGVDVTIDKWDLKEGHDAIAFMEHMVTDPQIEKVILVLDRIYAEKADGRRGGVGTETQIISPEIYQKADQDKFVGVTSELDDEEKPFLPTFYRSRIYIDLSQSDNYATNFDQLLRWVYNKPAHPKPPLGKQPQFLGETAVQLPTRSRAKRAIELLRNASPVALGAVEEYFDSLADSFEALRVTNLDPAAYDEAIVEGINAFLPYRNEYIEVAASIARLAPDEGAHKIHKLFERLIPYQFRPDSVTQWLDYQSDNYKFIIHEMFLYSIAILLKYERFDATAPLVQDGYYVRVPDDSEPMQSFEVLRQDIVSIRRRNERLSLRRLSLRADLLEQRSHTSGLAMMDLMQADFLLYFSSAIASLKEDRNQGWWPETLLYFERMRTPFEIFARSESRRYFERIRPLLRVESKEELGRVIGEFGPDNSQSRLWLPRWEHRTLRLKTAMNFDKLATKP
jgi:hypothetical protein